MGDTAKNLIKQNAGYQQLNALPQFRDFGNWLGDAKDQYASGKISLQDALKSASGGTYTKTRREELQKQIAALKGQLPQQEALGKLPGGGGNQQGSINGQIEQLENKMKDLDMVDATKGARQNEFFTDPLTGTLAATDQVKDNDLFKGMFGQGGINDQRQAEESRLMHVGFSLQPEDHEAYGQASDNIARMFGSSENNLAQALASRGLSTGASGAAGVAYSGLQGNKFEQLAQSQRQIAQDRMKMNQERLSSMQNMVNQGQQMANTAVGDQFSRNQEGVKHYDDSLKDSMAAAQAAQEQENQAFNQYQATDSSFGKTLGGLATGALGAGMGAVTGGLGTGIAAGAFGGDIGKAIANGGKK
jgi:hypothetical protein